MKTKILNTRERKQLFEKLSKIYGITANEMKGMFIESGKRKIRYFTGSLPREELAGLAQELNIDTIGMYIIALENFHGELRPRLSFDAVSLLRNKIKKQVIELDEKQAKKWLKGESLIIEMTKAQGIDENVGLLVLKYKNDLIGCGKFSIQEKDGKKLVKITNFVPKQVRSTLL